MIRKFGRVICDPFYYHGLTSIPAWISNHIRYSVWDEITYQLPNFISATVEVWEWISNFIPHLTMHVITFPCWDLSYTMLVKGAPGHLFIGHKLVVLFVTDISMQSCGDM